MEGWHTGAEWINSGTLMKRINFAAGLLGDTNRPGIRALIHRLKAQGDLSPEGFVDSCLDLIGPLHVEPEVRQNLVAHAKDAGVLRWGTRARGQYFQCGLRKCCNSSLPSENSSMPNYGQ